MKEKRLLLLPFAAGLLNAEAAQQRESNDNRPNVIIIYADDLGYGDLECYGAKNVETPNVNRLANEGIRLTNAHAVAATSTPSRYSLLSGEYAWRRPGTDIAAGNAAMVIKPGQFTLADAFRSAGYATAAIGKWHLGLGDKAGEQDWNAPLAAAPADLGFDYSYIMAATADRVPCVFIENGMVANYDPSAPIQVSYTRNFPGEPTGEDNPELLYNLKPSEHHHQSIVNGISRIGFMKGGGRALWKDENIADSIVAHAVRFIDEHRREPFFMYLATNDIHVPRFPHDRFRGKNKMGLRGDAIVQFDWTVGQIMDKLRETGLDKNTLVILSSDNGPVLDDGYKDEANERLNGHSPTGGLRGGKYSALEGGTRVPAIVSWPARVQGGRTADVLTSQIDWFASLASLVGARLPKGAAPDSYNRLGNLLGEDKTDRPWVVEQAANHALSIRTKDWKYIEPSDGPAVMQSTPRVETGYSATPQLYRLDARGEADNLAAKQPEKLFEMQGLLKRVRQQRANVPAVPIKAQTEKQ